MTVLVTGASGFIGSHVVMELSKRGYSVRAGMRNLDYSNIFSDLENVECVKMDLFDVDSLKNAVRGCDDVIHCAASLYIGAKDVKAEVVDPSVIGVENLCSVMVDVKRIVHTSSVAAIRSTKFENGKIFTNLDWCEDATPSYNSYGFAKAEAEKKIRAWAKGRDLRLVTIHPSIVFGPILHNKHMNGSMSYLKHFVKGPPFILDIHINFVDVRDVAKAHVNALDEGEDRGRYIIHKRGMWMKEIGKELSSKLPRKFATRKLPRLLAYIMAIFHPKLSVKRLRGTLGTHVDYDVGDAFETLSLPNYNVEDTLVDSVKSIQAQD
ncbi:NAD-dependent epimerase/dehydratase family protein [Candidatus Poseidoniaceae archaeon]|jgi:nucleoside-diphosphate-sugar epimerase|nr:NAD-dependent epimerase/dehydratase family protein [Candidatus Poseidoniaceae archaeon]